jgi:hypothetical protein
VFHRSGSWWERWRAPVVVKAEADTPEVDPLAISEPADSLEDDDCDVPWRTFEADVSDLVVRLNPDSSLSLEFLPGQLSSWDFLSLGSRFGLDASPEPENKLPRDVIRVGKVEITPSVELVEEVDSDGKKTLVEREVFYYFDGEKYVLKPVTVSSLPKSVSLLLAE